MKLFTTFLIFSIASCLTLASKCGRHDDDEDDKRQPQTPKCGCGESPPPPPPKHRCETQTPAPLCPCNPKAGCRIWRCPCTHDGFIMHPGNEPLNPPRPSWCPKCIIECDNFAIKCSMPYLQCSAEQVATYKCIEPIEV